MAVTLTAQLDDLTLVDDPQNDGSGILWKVQDLDGWWSAPPTETDSDPIPLADGNFEGLTFRRGKKVSLNGVVQAANSTLAKSIAWRKLAGIAPTGNAMTLSVTDELGTLTQRVRLDSAPQVIPYGRNSAFFRIPLLANDPRKYGPARVQQRGVGVPASTDGLQFPLLASGYIDFGAFTGTNQIASRNTGTAPTFATFAVTGGFDSAGFTIVSDAGDVLRFARTVPTGGTVMLSPFAGGRATIDGSDQTAYLTTANWSPIPPGGSRAYTLFAAGTADAAAGMTVTYREAWW